MFGKNLKESKFYSGRNSEQIEFRECLLSFGAESFSSSLLFRNTKIKIYRTVILPAVLYGCETWTLTLREERRLRVFENRVLRACGAYGGGERLYRVLVGKPEGKRPLGETQA
jgi:hypothetical protein